MIHEKTRSKKSHDTLPLNNGIERGRKSQAGVSSIFMPSL
jgi:hypothetical protein